MGGLKKREKSLAAAKAFAQLPLFKGKAAGM
jgi:hypothetical protein